MPEQDVCDDLDKWLADAIRDPECPVQFSPLLMEAKFTLLKLRADNERLRDLLNRASIPANG